VDGEGFRHAPWGLKGGKDGATGGVMIFEKSGQGRLLSSKIDNMYVKKGTVIRDLCPSGGGFGSPEDRSQAASQRDLDDGLIATEE